MSYSFSSLSHQCHHIESHSTLRSRYMKPKPMTTKKTSINVPWIGVGARKAFIKHLNHRNRRVRASWCLWTAHPSFICLQPSPSHTSHTVDGSREHNYSVMSIIALRIALPTRDAQPLWSWIIWYLNIGDAMMEVQSDHHCFKFQCLCAEVVWSEPLRWSKYRLYPGRSIQYVAMLDGRGLM